ncbi:MAG: cell division protein FtsL [Deltaproteobacteria bacterium]|nr:cell division protein FtsL [Deltaproteobacteria bacterium]MBW2124074.1 cell division protein FtsL [Deltaproteobacteria bacterium]
MGGVVSGFLLERGYWNQERPKNGSIRKGFRTMFFAFLILAAVIVLYLFFVSSRVWVVNLGYRTSRALREQKELLEVNRRLRIERATLISPERIDFYARQKLGMREPEDRQIRFVP